MYKKVNNGETRLASGIASDATEFTVTTGEGTKLPASNFIAGIYPSRYASVSLAKTAGKLEYAIVASRSTDVCTFGTRGMFGTSALDHNDPLEQYTVVNVLVASEIEAMEDGRSNYFVATVLGANSWAIATGRSNGSLDAGTELVFKAPASNTSTLQITVDGTAYNVRKFLGKALVAGDIIQNMVYSVRLVEGNLEVMGNIMIDSPSVFTVHPSFTNNARLKQYSTIEAALALASDYDRIVVLSSIEVNDELIAKANVTIEIPANVTVTIGGTIKVQDDNITGFKIVGEGDITTPGNLLTVENLGSAITIDVRNITAAGAIFWNESGDYAGDHRFRAKETLTIGGIVSGESQKVIIQDNVGGVNGSVNMFCRNAVIHTFSSFSSGITVSIVALEDITLPSNAQDNKNNFGAWTITARRIYLNDNKNFRGDQDVNIQSSFIFFVEEIFINGSFEFLETQTYQMSFRRYVKIKQTSATADTKIFNAGGSILPPSPALNMLAGGVVHNASAGANYLLNGEGVGALYLLGTLYSNCGLDPVNNPTVAVGELIVDSAVAF